MDRSTILSVFLEDLLNVERTLTLQDIILLVHRDAAFLEAMTPRLSDLGRHVLPPARTAAMALALVAQTPVTLAIIGETLAGRRDGHALARTLRDLWGLPSIVVAEADKALSLPLASAPSVPQAS
jgi:hypothetical protein